MIIRTVELSISSDKDANMYRYRLAASAKPTPDVVVFPELFTTGFRLDSIPNSATGLEDIRNSDMADCARENKIHLVAGTIPVRLPGSIYNMMTVFNPDGELIYRTEKVHLFNNMNEDTIFSPGTSGGVFQIDGVTAAGMVCYDIRFPELARKLTLKGAEVLFVPAQWPSGRIGLFRSFLKVRAAESQVFCVGCNLGGEDLGITFGGGGGVAHPAGRMMKGTLAAEGITDYNIRIEDIEDIRQKIDCLSDRRVEEYGE